MLANNITVLFLNLLIVVGFSFFSKYKEKTYIVALVYTGVLFAVQLTQGVLIPALLLALLGNVVISYMFFRILKYLDSGFLYMFVAIIGCIVLWYIAYLPIGYSAFHSLKELGVVGK